MKVIEKSVFTEIQNWKSEDCDGFCFYWIDYESGERVEEHLCFRIMEINNVLRITGNLKTDTVIIHIIWMLQVEIYFFVCALQTGRCILSCHCWL